MARAVVAIFALVILLVGGVAAVNGALETAGEDRLVVNETFTPGSGGVVQLDNSNLEAGFYDNSTTVYNASDVEMTEGTDYNWLEGNGTVEVLAGGDLANDPNGSITYGYVQTTPEQRAMASVLGLIPNGIGLVLPVFVFVFLLLLINA